MNIFAELESVLKEEQEHLLSGNFSALEALIGRKPESLMPNGFISPLCLSFRAKAPSQVV